MAAITYNQSGEFIFIASETAAGLQRIIRFKRDKQSGIEAYAPGTGNAANVAATIDPDRILFFGDFAPGVILIQHSIADGSNTDISVAVVGTKVCNACLPDPATADGAVIAVNTDQDVFYTADAGGTYETWTVTLGFDATALALLWSGDYDLNRVFICGDNLTDLDVLYSPNEMTDTVNLEDATLGALTNICSIDVVKEPEAEE